MSASNGLAKTFFIPVYRGYGYPLALECKFVFLGLLCIDGVEVSWATVCYHTF